MTIKRYGTGLLWLFCFLFLHAQTTEEEKNFIRGLIQQEVAEAHDENIEVNTVHIPYFVTKGEEMDRYTVYFHLIACEDLNGDEIPDYVIQRVSEGLTGGNVNTTTEYIFYIMQDKDTVKKRTQF